MKKRKKLNSLKIFVDILLRKCYYLIVERKQYAKFNNMKENFGDFIKRVRVEKGLSIDDLAEASGYSAVQIRNFEKNKFKPQVFKLKQLADALGCDYEELYKKVN